MVNYNEGKIYKIESTIGDKVYYGSTTKKRLCDRMTKHRGDYNKWLKGKAGLVMSYKLFEEYGLENCKIILIENCPCDTKDELRAREAHYIRNFDCVNKNIPGRTRKEYYEDNKDNIKQYYEDNKNKILEQKKQYRKVNKDKMAERDKQYYKDNKNKILERDKQYYKDNKNKILEKMKIKYNCICGSCICKGDKSKHERTNKHIKFLESQ